MTIRVLLGATTAMVRSALHGALSECEDIELVQPSAFDAAPDDIDVVVLHQVALGDCDPALRAITGAPRIGVVAIGDDGIAGNLYRVDREGWRFTPAGQHGLADAIRAVARAH
ncbi:hypothetical protein GCM10009087_47650 [Sphingomonas oligophenolica]|uniref:Uncharacterized protein n=1 Tax=Sphingomonas oligophenolica TaxID=301154 RepID=A0ABU9Y775_9SPHN